MGVVEAGAVTKVYAHVNGCKLWVVRCVADGEEQQQSYALVQQDGDLLYVPLGWPHEVHTVQG